MADDEDRLAARAGRLEQLVSSALEPPSADAGGAGACTGGAGGTP